MPPSDSPQLSDEEFRKISTWVKFGPFGIDPKNLDPGPTTVRRLNRQEYGNTIRALMGVPFDEKLLFPPDDSGYGFDNVADALMVSPILLDKYLQAAETVVDRAVPKATKIVPRKDFNGSDFEAKGSHRSGRSIDGKKSTTVAREFEIDSPGKYNVQISTKQHGSFEFDPARYTVTCRIDDEEAFSVELGWDENKLTIYDAVKDWALGKHAIVFDVNPVKPEKDPGQDEELEERDSGTHVHFEIHSVSIEGPIGTEERVHPPNYERFFSRDAPPDAPDERRQYAADVLRQFTKKAFRGQVAQETVDRLVAIAEAVYSQPDQTFETGIGRAIVAVLASPRFLFSNRKYRNRATRRRTTPWSTKWDWLHVCHIFCGRQMPDDELFRLAEEGKLRSNLLEQVDRMLADPRADAFVTNFVGQWLRTRDISNVDVDPAVVLGFAEELEELRDWFRSRFRRGSRRRDREVSPESQAKIDRYREIRRILDRVDDDLKPRDAT